VHARIAGDVLLEERLKEFRADVGGTALREGNDDLDLLARVVGLLRPCLKRERRARGNRRADETLSRAACRVEPFTWI
jgi:hypothetical protein